MATLTAAEIEDLVNGTLANYGPLGFEQISQDIQHFEIVDAWMKGDKTNIDGGVKIARHLLTDRSGSARHAGLFETRNVDVQKHMRTLEVPWRHADTQWAFERREVLMNKGKALLHKVIEPRRQAAMLDLCQELEDKAWGAAPATTNETDPYSIPYYIVKNASTGFNGGAPGSHTTVANVSPTTVTSWKNYTAQYTNVSQSDLVKKIKTGLRKTDWRSPNLINSQDYSKGKLRMNRFYTNDSVLGSLEDLAEGNNDRLGTDLHPIAGKSGSNDTKKTSMGFLTLKGFPIVYIPKLDDDSQNPVYQIDHSTFMVVCLDGDVLHEAGVKQLSDQPNTFANMVTLTYNYLCINRRKQAVYATA